MRDDFGGLFAASTALRRDPTAGEVVSGIPCGPFDQQLLNEMYFALSSMLSELKSLLTAASIAPDETKVNQILAAIRAIGGGGRLNSFAPYLTAGAISYPVPSNISALGYMLIGGGGGGSGNTGSAGGGGAGVLGFLSNVGGTTVTGVVGAAGTGVTSGTAGNGGATTLSGSGASAGGGNGGGAGGSPGNGGTATGGLIQFTGGPGEDLDSTQYFAQGGTSLGMPSGRYSAGVNPGDGGGASSPSGSPANTGYNGAPGAIIFF